MSKKENTKVMKGSKIGLAIVTGMMLVIGLGMQIFASTNGYGNMFFMLKTLVTGEAHGEDAIFSDKDITLSYKSVKITNDISMKVNRLELKENDSTLFLNITNTKENNEALPLHYVVRINRPIEEGGYIPVFRPEAGDITFDGNNSNSQAFVDEIKIPCQCYGEELIRLNVQDKAHNTLKNIVIDLKSREITVEGSENFEKISQIELKKYLNSFSELNNASGENDVVLMIANYLPYKVDGKSDVKGREKINEVAKEFYGEKVQFEKVNGKEVLKSDGAWAYDDETDSYREAADSSEYQYGICLKIEDIDYKDGIYTVKYIYTLATQYDTDDEKIEELPQYETTIRLKRNDDAKYSKYQIVELEKGTEIKEKVDEDITDENNEEHKYEVIKNSGTKGPDGTHTTLDGTHIESCTECNYQRRVPHKFTKWYTLRNSEGNIYAYTLWCNECKDYIYTNDLEFVKKSGYEMIEKEDEQELSHELVEEGEVDADFTKEDIYGKFILTLVEDNKTKDEMTDNKVFRLNNVFIYFTNDGYFGTNIPSTDDPIGLHEEDVIGTWKIRDNKIVLQYPDSKEVTIKYDNTMNTHDNISRKYDDYTIYLEKDYSWLDYDRK